MVSLSDSADPDAMRIVRRTRRRLVRTEHLLAASVLEKRAGVSPGELRRRAMDGTVIRVRIGRNDFYPALCLRPNRPATRLARISRATYYPVWGRHTQRRDDTPQFAIDPRYITHKSLVHRPRA